MLKVKNQTLVPVKSYVYNASVVTENYHSRSVIRIFELPTVIVFNEKVYFVYRIGIKNRFVIIELFKNDFII